MVLGRVANTRDDNARQYADLVTYQDSSESSECMAGRSKAYYVCKCCANQSQKANFHHWQRARQQEICKLHRILRITTLLSGLRIPM